MKIAVKRELAKELYLVSELTQKEISKKVDVTEATMSKWCKEWNTLKTAGISTKKSIEERACKMIDGIYLEAEGENRTITNAEADKIAKIFKTISNLDKEQSLAVYIQVFTEYNKWYANQDLELCQKNLVFQDKFITLKAGE